MRTTILAKIYMANDRKTPTKSCDFSHSYHSLLEYI